MNMFLNCYCLTLFAFFASHSCAFLQGPNQNLTSIVSSISGMSDDGSRVIIFSMATLQIKYYTTQPNGVLNHQNSIPTSRTFDGLEVSADGSLVGLSSNETALICSISATSLIQFQNITLSFGQIITSISFSISNQFVVLGENSGNIYIYKLSGSYVLFDTITETQRVVATMMPINNYFAVGGGEKILRIYEILATNVVLLQSHNNNDKTIIKISVSPDQSQIAVLSSNCLRVYSGGSGTYSFLQEIALNETNATGVVTCSSNKVLMTVGNVQNNIQVYFEDGGSFSLNETVTLDSGISSISSDQLCEIIQVFTSGYSLVYHRCRDQNCLYCSDPVICDTYASIPNTTNLKNITQNNQNFINSFCLDEIVLSNNKCKTYCAEQCNGCTGNNKNCTLCSDFYTKDEQGTCVATTGHNFIKAVRSFSQIFKVKPFKVFFIILGDLRFYEYHKRQYSGDLAKMIELMRFIEDKQWEVIKHGTFGDTVNEIVQGMPNYENYSNQKYLQIERKDEFFPRNIHEYFFYSLPMLIIVFFIANKLFYKIFNYEISKHIRMFSFWGYFAELAIQGNIQIFSFLAFRQFLQPISFNFNNKIYMAFVILSFWIVVVFAFTSYYLYFYLYGKLSKYFLVNNYRIKYAFTSNILTYGVRPFLKGAIHSLCYDHYGVQISLLFSIEILTMIGLCYFQLFYGIHRKKFLLFSEIGIYGIFAFFDFLLLLTYVYGVDMSDDLLIVTQILIAFMILRIVIDFIPTQFSDDQTPIQDIQFGKDSPFHKNFKKDENNGIQKNIFDTNISENISQYKEIQPVPQELEHAAIKRFRSGVRRFGQIIIAQQL